MLVIRDAQVKQIQSRMFETRLPAFAREVYDELATIHFLPSDAYDRFREAIEADLRKAYQFGITRRDGLIQFASYRYSIGELWYDDPKFRRILERPVGETEKWAMIDGLLGED